MARAATKTKETARRGPSAAMPDEIPKGSLKAILAQDGINKTNQLLMVAPEHLRVIPGFNPRIHEVDQYRTDAAELVDSIRNEGFYLDKPIAGYIGKEGDEDVIYITDGHRRYEAVETLRLEGIEIASLPVVLKPAETDMAKLTIATVRSNTGRRLTFFENAIVVRRLSKHAGMSSAEIGSALGFTERAVEDFFILIEAPKKVRDFVKMERIAGTEAVRILRKLKNPEQAAAKIEEMVKAAEVRGKGKATRKDSGDAPVKGRKPKLVAEPGEDEGEEEVTSAKRPIKEKDTVTLTVNFVGHVGDEVPITDIRNFKNLFANQDWFKLDDDRPNLVIIQEDVKFVAYLTLPREAAEAAAEEEAEDEGDEGEEDETIEDERQSELADL